MEKLFEFDRQISRLQEESGVAQLEVRLFMNLKVRSLDLESEHKVTLTFTCFLLI
jgi:hypothetical protein